MADKSARPIIVVKKKAGHGGHHGGSWKVAYADFVTAMMAFFLVMWIMGMDSHTKDLIEGYFTNPIGFKKSFSGGANPMSSGNSPANMDIHRVAMMSRAIQHDQFEQAKKEIEKRVAGDISLKPFATQVQVIVGDDGLRIELLESGHGPTFFGRGSTELTPEAKRLLGVIAQVLKPLPNDIVLEGHTDAAHYGDDKYTNWELSTDRANAARRALAENGIGTDRIAQVRGYADHDLRVPGDPLAAANRRTSILLPFKTPRLVTKFEGGAFSAAAIPSTPSGS